MFKLQIKYLSFFFGIISILSFFNILYSYYFNLYLNLDTYYFTLVTSLILFIVLFKFGKYDFKSNIFEKILTIFLGYLLIPFVLSIPFYFSIYNLTFSNSFFEAISGFTSTGFTVFDNIKLVDQSLIIWRSSTQWIGGLYFLFSIIYLIDIFDDSFKKTLTNYISFNSSEILKQAAKIFILYTSLTILIFIILNIFSIRTFDSLNLALTIISSGGFLPVNELSMIIKENVQIIIFSLLMLFSFFSLFFSYNLIFLRKKNVNFFYEDLHLFAYLVVVVTIFFLFFSFNYDFFINLFAVISSMTNIGFSLSSGQENLNFIYLILVIIGGSFFSTSSGLRFIKIYSLFKFSLNQILSFSRPKNVFMNKLIFTKINFNLEEINKYFLTIIIFILSLSILTSLLSLSGITFVNSFKLSILTLMNTVNSSIYGLEEFDFNNLQLFSKYCLIFFMIVGRIELLTILLLIKKFLFKN
ncbi:TrkH family potassium uptake protein [Candidatus Pelagibacter sp.]|uniref:TrkH family potassium uptake protein n=1 Tax=Candidatus Pelagibacter sp. TaxID=2024849 RepID=UPI003F82636B